MLDLLYRRPCFQHLVSELGSSTRCRPSSQPAQHSVLRFITACTVFGLSLHPSLHSTRFLASFEETEKKVGKHKLESRCVRSSLGVSQSAVLYFLDRNCLRWASCATTTSRTTPVRVSFDWTIIGRTSRFHCSHRCSQPKPNRLEVLSNRQIRVQLD